MASHSGTLYIGMTNDLKRRAHEHQAGIAEGFTKKYACTRLIYFEQYAQVEDAIAREKKLKKWNRKKKEWLIGRHNPEWIDLTKEIGNPGVATRDSFCLPAGTASSSE